MPHRKHELGHLGDLVGATAIVTVDRRQGTDHQDLAARLVKETDRACRVLVLGEAVRHGPTTAGLSLLPLMIAVMAGSGGSGWLVAAVVGQLKMVVALGAGTMTLSLFSRLNQGTPTAVPWADEVVMRPGMGMVMAISKLVILVQNQADRQQLGAVTAQAAFFRIIGAAIGTAVLGGVLATRLWDALPDRTSVLHLAPAAIRALDPAVRAEVVDGFADALQMVFLVATPVTAVGFLLTFLLPNTRAARAWGRPVGTRERPAGYCS